ncbi:DUF2939 domain-containing protein [Aureimonas psammosilenae]|uniref:DUF2939 domain-containing protein n=1 Tax=Aureimonas psammosilenae TaxID=2495496 RepID=UPI0012612002|nr:DUF2939 domain-containing protein [Aureimonas psammosilenae]
MRKWVWATAVAVMLGVGYVAWPFVGMAQLAGAVHSRDAADILARVDIASVRRSLLNQMLDEATRDTDVAKRLGHLGRRAAVGFAQTVLDAQFARFINDDAVRVILSDGRLPPDVENAAQGRDGGSGSSDLHFARLPESPLRYLQDWRFRSPITFEATIGEEAEPGRWVELRLRRTGTTWILTGIRLPAGIIDQLKPVIRDKLREAGL